MGWLEILLAFAMNLVELSVGVALISGGVAGFFVILSILNTAEAKLAEATPVDRRGTLERQSIAHREATVKTLRIASIVLFVSLPLAMIPSMDQVWKVRIGLIKLQLASPENIQKGADVIERIGAKLECKYLGCEEKKKN